MLDHQRVRPTVVWFFTAYLVLVCPALGPVHGAQQPSLPERPRLSGNSSPLQQGRVLFIHSRTAYLHASLLEEKLMARPEFGQLGLSITRDEHDADLDIEVERSSFTTKFTYSVLDPETGNMVASGQVDSLFGTASGKIAKKVLATLASARRP